MPETLRPGLFAPLGTEMASVLKFAAVAAVLLIVLPKAARWISWTAADRREFRSANKRRDLNWRWMK